MRFNVGLLRRALADVDARREVIILRRGPGDRDVVLCRAFTVEGSDGTLRVALEGGEAIPKHNVAWRKEDHPARPIADPGDEVVSECGVSSRLWRSLVRRWEDENHRAMRLSDLAVLTDVEILGLKNIGLTSVHEVRELLSAKGIRRASHG